MSWSTIRVGLPLLLCTAVATGCGRSSPPPADPREGRTLYALNGCPACHGADGRGDGPLAAVSTPRPRDFHQPAPAATPRTVDQVAEIIATGRPATPNPMPGYSHLSETDRRNIAAYVLSLANGEPAPRE